MGDDTRRMKVIPKPEPNTRAVIVSDKAVKGEGSLSYTCGSCGRTLLRNVNYKQVQNVVFKCWACAAFNEIPATHLAH